MASSHSSSVPDRLALGARRQLHVEVVEPVVAEQIEHEREHRPQLVPELLLRGEDVRVVHREPAHPREAVHDAGELVAVHGAELEEAQRQLAVAARPALKIRMCIGQFMGFR